MDTAQQGWNLRFTNRFDHSFGRFPGVAWYSLYQPSPHSPKGHDGILVGETHPSGKQWCNIFREALIEFLEHSFLCVRPTDRVPFQRKIMVEARNHPITVQTQLEQPFVEIEQVTVLVPLKQCPQLGSEQFLRLE